MALASPPGRFPSLRFIPILLCLLFAASMPAHAQTTTTLGAIEGTVTDETGAAVPGVG